jgi:hypothetical protein
VKLRVRLRLLSTAEGGRRGWIEGNGNYRPTWYWHPWPHVDVDAVDAAVVALSPVRLHPGEQGVAELEPLSPHLWRSVVVGQRLGAYEGARRVADVDVEAILT